MREVFTSKRISSDCLFKSNHRQVKISMLFPRCAIYVPLCLELFLVPVCLELFFVPVCLELFLVPVCLELFVVPVCLELFPDGPCFGSRGLKKGQKW